jgi:hypothetical protein
MIVKNYLCSEFGSGWEHLGVETIQNRLFCTVVYYCRLQTRTQGRARRPRGINNNGMQALWLNFGMTFILWYDGHFLSCTVALSVDRSSHLYHKISDALKLLLKIEKAAKTHIGWCAE